MNKIVLFLFFLGCTNPSTKNSNRSLSEQDIFTISNVLKVWEKKLSKEEIIHLNEMNKKFNLKESNEQLRYTENKSFSPLLIYAFSDKKLAKIFLLPREQKIEILTQSIPCDWQHTSDKTTGHSITTINTYYCPEKEIEISQHPQMPSLIQVIFGK